MTWFPHTQPKPQRGIPEGNWTASMGTLFLLTYQGWVNCGLTPGSGAFISLLDLKEGLKAPNHSVLFYKTQCKCLSFQLKCWGPEKEVTTLFLWLLSSWIKAKRRKRKILTEFPLSFSKVSVSWNMQSIYMSWWCGWLFAGEFGGCPNLTHQFIHSFCFIHLPL